MRKLCFLLCLGVAWSAIGAQGPADARLSIRITATHGCGTLAEILPKIGAKAGVKLAADATSGNTLVFLSFKDQPLSAVMKLMADTLDLTWFSSRPADARKYTLGQTEAQRKKVQAEREAARHAELEAAIQGAKDSLQVYRDALKLPEDERQRLAKEYVLSGKADQSEDGSRSTTYPYDPKRSACHDLASSATRLAVDLLANWSDEDWRRFLSDGRVVYSTSPTSAQLALPAGYLEAGKRWRAETIADEARKSEDGPVGFNGHTNGNLRGSGAASPETTTPAKLRMTVSGDSRLDEVPNSLSVTPELLDAGGHVLVWGEGPSLNWRNDVPEAGPEPVCTKDPLFDKEYTAPDALVKLGAGKGALLETHERWLAAYPAPAFLDPLNLQAGPFLTDLAGKVGVPTFVRVSDSLVSRQLPRGKTTLRKCLETWAADTLTFDVKNGWLIGNPSREERLAGDDSCPRPLFRKFYSDLRAGGVPAMDAVADAAHSLTDRQASRLDNTFQETWRDVSIGPLAEDGALAGLRFWATLDQPRKERLLSGRPLRVAQLTREQWTALSTVFRTRSRSFPEHFEVTEEMPFGLSSIRLTLDYRDSIAGFLFRYGYPMHITDQTGTRTEENLAFLAIRDAVDLYRTLRAQSEGELRREVVRGRAWTANFDLSASGPTPLNFDMHAIHPLSQTPEDLSKPPAELAKQLEQGKKDYESGKWGKEPPPNDDSDPSGP